MDDARSAALPWLARLLQVNDSAFPTGGYAHSYGFEQIVHFGLVRDAASMGRHLEEHVWPMLIHFELPVVRFACEAARRNDLAGLIELAACVEATKTAREAREASRSVGGRRLHAFGEMGAAPIVEAFARAVEEGRAWPHHAVVYGLGLAAMPREAVLGAWAFQSLSAICLSAPKLFRIGQDAAQAVLTASLAPLEKNVELSLGVARDELGWFDSLVEMASMQHEIADERLFIS
jgi:urease accessory protein